jgi:hypothetical protein
VLLQSFEIRQKDKGSHSNIEVAQLRRENLDAVFSSGRMHFLPESDLPNVQYILGTLPPRRRPIWRKAHSQTYNIDSQRSVSFRLVFG